MTCKGCKNGKYIRKTDTVHCRLHERTLIVDRAYKCDDYELKTEIKKYRERMKEREENERNTIQG